MSQAQQKNRRIFFAITIFLALALTGVGNIAFSQSNTPIQNTTVQSPLDKAVSSIPTPEKLDTVPKKNLYDFKTLEKKGPKYAILKFLAAMAGVLVSILAIFIGLKIYKKVVLSKALSSSGNEDWDNSLESPKDFKGAINLFLHKTDK